MLSFRSSASTETFAAGVGEPFASLLRHMLAPDPERRVRERKANPRRTRGI